MQHRPARWRILSVFAGATLEAAFGGDKEGFGSVEEFPGCEAEVHIMTAPAVSEFQLQLQTWQPNFVYLYGGYQSIDSSLTQCKLNSVQFQTVTSTGDVQALTPSDFADLFRGLDLQAVFLDAAQSEDQAAALFTTGVPACLYWPKDQEVNALAAAGFTRALFGTLRNRTASVVEAYALALRATQVHFTTQVSGRWHMPLLPGMYHGGEISLPSNSSVPLPMIEDVDLAGGLAAAIPGWEDVRLLAPHAEVRLLVCGQENLVDASKLSLFGEALRATMVLEVRNLVLTHWASCDRVPAHLPAGCTALRCDVQTSSGAVTSIVLGGPPAVLGNRALVEHALRQTLVADALSMQIKLPVPGTAQPVARSSASIAGGASVVDVVVATSVWAVHVLRLLCQEISYRGLVLLGIAAVGSTQVASFSPCDAQRYKTFLACSGDKNAMLGTYMNLECCLPMSASTTFNPGVMMTSGRAAAPNDSTMVLQRSGSFAAVNGYGHHSLDNSTGISSPSYGPEPSCSPPPWTSSRPPLSHCTEEEFIADLIQFYVCRKNGLPGATVSSPDLFPTAVLNSRRLDLFSLYREVVSRGGYCMAAAINWKGSIFPRMRNYSEDNKMTGVGNSLKRHYQVYLLDYERANPRDVRQEVCVVCYGAATTRANWVQCDECNNWVHGACAIKDKWNTVLVQSKQHMGQRHTCQRCLQQTVE